MYPADIFFNPGDLLKSKTEGSKRQDQRQIPHRKPLLHGRRACVQQRVPKNFSHQHAFIQKYKQKVQILDTVHVRALLLAHVCVSGVFAISVRICVTL